MIVVKIELWPGGDAERAKEIGRIGLANVSGLKDSSDYVFVAKTDRGEIYEGQVRKHRRSQGMYKLLSSLLNQIVGTVEPIDQVHEATLREVGSHMASQSTSH